MPPILMPEKKIPPKQQPFISERPYQGMEVQTERTPVSRLLVYVEGKPWPVTYYRQLLTEDEESSSSQTTRDPLYQQYQRISNFELKVNEPLTSEFDEESSEHKTVGASTIYPSIIPIKGDMFTADIGDGRAGLFTLESVEMMNIFKDATYKVRYKIVDFLNASLVKGLEDKVIKRTHFVKDHVLTGQDPLVVDDEYNQIMLLRGGIEKLKRLYYSTNFVHEVTTFLVPKQEVPTYDPFMMDVMELVFPVEDRLSSERLTKYNCGGDTGFKVKTIWDCILNRDATLVKSIAKEFDCILTRSIEDRPTLGSIRFSPIPRVMFPKGRPLRAGYMEGPSAEIPHYPLDSPYNIDEQEQINLKYLVRRNILNGLGPVDPVDMYIPPVHPVGLDQFYMLSEYFYNRAEFGQSKLELQTWALLDGKKLDKEVLVDLLQDAPNWGALEQFYYIPLLIILIQYGVRGA